jgi:hypothetical protein
MCYRKYLTLCYKKNLKMSQLTLEFTNREDLALLLSFAKRLKVHVVSVVTNDSKTPSDNRLSLMKKAANDPLFLADIAEVTNDFKSTDGELQ